MEGFNYVINPPVKPRVAFGSALEREVLPLQGPGVSPFMRRQMGGVLLGPGPVARSDERDHLEMKLPSKLGHTAFASKSPRLPSIQNTNLPCVGAYEIEFKKPVKQAVRPFNVGSSRADLKQFPTPAPNSYMCPKSQRQLKVNLAFGTQRKILPAVQIICSPFNAAQCHNCHAIPVGDYWHNFRTNVDLCRPCYQKLLSLLKSCSSHELERGRVRRFLQSFSQARYCSFLHDHKAVTLTAEPEQLMPTKIFKLKIKLENYLSLYM